MSYPFLFLARTLMRFLCRKYGFHVFLGRTGPENVVLAFPRDGRKHIIQRGQSLDPSLALPWWANIVGQGFSRWFSGRLMRGYFSGRFSRWLVGSCFSWGFSGWLFRRGMLFHKRRHFFPRWSEAGCYQVSISVNHRWWWWYKIILASSNVLHFLSIFYPRLQPRHKKRDQLYSFMQILNSSCWWTIPNWLDF